jgi:hypothetical protein
VGIGSDKSSLNLILARKYNMTISSTKTKSMAMWGEPNTESKNCDKGQNNRASNRIQILRVLYIRIQK